MVIGHNTAFDYREMVLLKSFGDRRAGDVVAFAACAGITHGQHGCTKGFRNRGGRHLPPRFELPDRASLRRAGAGPPSTDLACSESWFAEQFCCRNLFESFRRSTSAP